MMGRPNRSEVRKDHFAFLQFFRSLLGLPLLLPLIVLQHASSPSARAARHAHTCPQLAVMHYKHQQSICISLSLDCRLHLVRSTRGRTWQPLHAACPQTHLASWQEECAFITILVNCAKRVREAHCELAQAFGGVFARAARRLDLARFQGFPVEPLKPLVALDVGRAPVQYPQPPRRLALQQPRYQILPTHTAATSLSQPTPLCPPHTLHRLMHVTLSSAQPKSFQKKSSQEIGLLWCKLTIYIYIHHVSNCLC